MNTSVFIFALFVSVSLNLQPAASVDLLSKVKSFVHWPSDDKPQEDITYRLFTRDRSIIEPEVFHSDVDFDFKSFSLERPTTVLIHGWKGYGNCTFTFTLVSAYLSAKDHNVIAVDWSGAGSRTNYYPDARKKTQYVAFHLANFLDNLHAKTGVKLEDIHIVGHSLGAHIAGIAGRLVKTGTIKRITGCDPAGPLFSEKDHYGRLAQDSASFVDVIHSSPKFIGFAGTLGHVDFYPNGHHRLQPGCGADVFGRCSHRRGFQMYAESVSNPTAFQAVPCADWESFERRECDAAAVIPMGIDTPSTARGRYYLATNNDSPFGTGMIWQMD